MKDRNTIRAIIYICLAYVFLSLMMLCAKLATRTLPPTEVLFSRFFLGLIFLIPSIVKSNSFSFKITNIKMSLLRNCAGLGGMILSFSILSKIPVALNVLFLNSSSLFIPLCLFCFFKERTNIKTISFMLIGFFGIFVIVSSSLEGANLIYYIFGVISAVLAALAYIGIKKLSIEHSPLNIVFYFHLFGSLVILLFFSHGWKLPIYQNLYLLILVGLFGVLFQVFLSYALSFSSMQLIAPFIFTGVIFSTFLDWIYWGELPNNFFILGSFLIMFSIVKIVRNEGK